MKVIILILSIFIAGVYACHRQHLWASPVIQLISNESTYWSSGLYYNDDGYFRYVDFMGSSCFMVNVTTGETSMLFLQQLENKKVAFSYPFKSNPKKGVVAADNQIFPYEMDTSNNVITFGDPVTVTSDVGYYIIKGHADSKGRLTIIMLSKADSFMKRGRMYTFNDKTPVLTKQFDSNIHDFVLSHDEKTMYVLEKTGRSIFKYNYDINDGGLNGGQKVFALPKQLAQGQAMTGIEIDDTGILYVTTNYGYIGFINSARGTLIKKIKSPNTFMTGITFSTNQDSGLYISTTKQCNEDETPAGAVLHMFNFNGTGIADYPVVW